MEVLSAGTDLAPLLVRLVAEMDQLRAEMAQVRRDNLEWRQQAGYWQSRHADAVQRLAAAQQENEQLRGEMRQLQAERFGRRSEKQSGSDRCQELDDPVNNTPQRPRGRQPGQPAPRRRDYRHLPAREQVLDLPEAEKVCPSGSRSKRAAAKIPNNAKSKSSSFAA